MTAEQDAALARLVAERVLTPDQAAAVTEALHLSVSQTGSPIAAGPAHATDPLKTPGPDGGVSEPGHPQPMAGAFNWTLLLAEAGGYIGGAFVLAAVIILTSTRWADLSRIEHVAILGLPGLLLIAAAAWTVTSAPGGLAAQRRGAGVRGPSDTPADDAKPGGAKHKASPIFAPDGLRRRLSGTQLTLAGALIGAAAGQYATDRWTSTVVGATALVVYIIGYLACPAAITQVAAAVAVGVASVGAVQAAQPNTNTTRESAWALIALGVLWALLLLVRVLRERGFALLAAGVFTFFGGEQLVQSMPYVDGRDQHGYLIGYIVIAVLAAAELVAYVRLREISALLVGVVALATVVPQIIIDYTNGSLGAGGALLIVGLSIVGASAVGFRLMREGR